MRLKINKQNQKSSPEVIQQARKELEEKRISNNMAECCCKKTNYKLWVVFISLILVINTGLFFYFQPKKQLYLKYLPETNLNFTIPKENIRKIIDSPESFSFLSPAFKQISQTATQLKLASDLQILIQNIDQDLIISSTGSDKQTKLLAIAQISSNYDKTSLEADIKQNFDISSEIYRGENIIKVVSLNSKNENFAYSFVGKDQVLLIGNNTDSIKQGIDKSK